MHQWKVTNEGGLHSQKPSKTIVEQRTEEGFPYVPNLKFRVIIFGDAVVLKCNTIERSFPDLELF